MAIRYDHEKLSEMIEIFYVKMFSLITNNCL